MPTCELCRHEVNDITTHFLILQTGYHHQKSKKEMPRDRVKSRPVALCRPCHKRVHMLRNKDVEQYF